MIATIILISALMSQPRKEVHMIDINSKVEKFCADYDMPVDQMDHPNSILTAEGDRVFISDKEIELMERIVAAEARGESCEAQEGVATVILNRWQEGSFGETLTDIMTASGQFAAPYQGEISMSVHLAVKNAIVYYNTYCQDLPTQILYFRSDHYHTFGTPYISMGNLYFSARDGVLL